jgi:uncharacterized protein
LSDLTPRQAIVLAALGAERRARFAPVQVQKLFFLIDENVAAGIGGRQFAFVPYDYGPFDQDVYHELERLARAGMVQIDAAGPAAGRRQYTVTPEGQQVGEQLLARLPQPIVEYIKNTSRWVRSLSFAELVGAIYRAYPRMRENSVFVG